MAKVYEIDGVIPGIDPPAFVHLNTVLIGPRCYIGPCACLKGDPGPILIGDDLSRQ